MVGKTPLLYHKAHVNNRFVLCRSWDSYSGKQQPLKFYPGISKDNVVNLFANAGLRKN